MHVPHGGNTRTPPGHTQDHFATLRAVPQDFHSNDLVLSASKSCSRGGLAPYTQWCTFGRHISKSRTLCCKNYKSRCGITIPPGRDVLGECPACPYKSLGPGPKPTPRCGRSPPPNPPDHYRNLHLQSSHSLGSRWSRAWGMGPWVRGIACEAQLRA